MSGIFQRISLIFRAKTDKALDKLEDPRQTLDYSYQRQLELLQKVRRGVADVATSRKRIAMVFDAGTPRRREMHLPCPSTEARVRLRRHRAVLHLARRVSLVSRVRLIAAEKNRLKPVSPVCYGAK